MVSIQLDPAHERRLGELARGQGQDAAELARRVLVDYLDFQGLPKDSDDAWAEASARLERMGTGTAGKWHEVPPESRREFPFPFF